MNPDFFQLPFHFSVEKLQEELQICENENWTSHFNTNDYNGDWTSISLRSASGKNNDINSFPNQVYQNTPLLEKCSYINEIISSFECEKEAVRLLNLAPNSVIKEHVDNDTSYEDGFFRIHIPILTNEKVYFNVNKKNVPMKMGECWYANFQLPHSVANESMFSRVHLIIDCLRNSWSDELFSNAGFVNLAPKNRTYSKEVNEQIIQELMKNPTETNLKLIQQLQQSK